MENRLRSTPTPYYAIRYSNPNPKLLQANQEPVANHAAKPQVLVSLLGLGCDGIQKPTIQCKWNNSVPVQYNTNSHYRGTSELVCFISMVVLPVQAFLVLSVPGFTMPGIRYV